MIIDHDKVTLLEKSGYLVICSHNRNVSMIDVKPCLGWPPDLDGQSHSWPLPGYPQSQTLILPLSPIYLCYHDTANSSSPCPQVVFRKQLAKKS